MIKTEVTPKTGAPQPALHLQKLIFAGVYFHSIDQKKRFLLPAAFKHLVGTRQLIATAFQREVGEVKIIYIRLYPANVWNQLLRRLSPHDQSAYTDASYDVTPDKTGRISLPIEFSLRTGFRDGTEIRVKGCGSYIEVLKINECQAMPLPNAEPTI